VEKPNISASGTWASTTDRTPSSWAPTIMPRRWFSRPMTGPWNSVGVSTTTFMTGSWITGLAFA